MVIMETLIGIRPGKLFKLYRQNISNICLRKVPKMLPVILLSIRNEIYARKENKKYADKLKSFDLDKPPVFIIGHWRSGTSFLHKLLAQDPQFAYPTVFQTYNPSTFLYTEPLIRDKMEAMSGRKRPMDNMTVRFNDPAEEEFAISVLCLHSPVLGWVFPKNETYYDRYLSFRDVPQAEIDLWKNSFLSFLKKVALASDNRQLLLKSPPNTSRIKVLLEMFPQAKFIHIHRNPYHVFRSTLKLYQNTVSKFNMQCGDRDDLITGILDRYIKMYDVFFEDRKLLAANQFIDIGFEDLQKDFDAGIGKIYSQLELNGFDTYGPLLNKYLEQNKNYKKNKYEELDPKLKKRIAKAWQLSFEEWSYSE